MFGEEDDYAGSNDHVIDVMRPSRRLLPPRAGIYWSWSVISSDMLHRHVCFVLQSSLTLDVYVV